MRVFLITADDPIYVPVFMKKFLEQFQGELVGTAIIPPHPRKMTFRGYIYDHYQMYGPVAFMMMGFRYVQKRYLSGVLRCLKIGGSHSLRSLLLEYGCPVLTPHNINSKDFLHKLENYDLDLIVSVASSQIFRKRILGIPRLGCVNIHGALLPKHRGINPSFWVLLNGDAQTGTTVHFMDEKIDTGRIILQQPIPVANNETLNSLSLKIARTGARVLIEAIAMLEDGTESIVISDQEGAGSYHSFPTKEDGRRFRDRGLSFF